MNASKLRLLEHHPTYHSTCNTMEKNEEVLNAFLEGWRDEDYQKMFDNAQITWKDKKTVKNIEALFSFVRLKAFKGISSSTLNSVKRTFVTELTLEGGDKVISAINVICEAAPYEPRTYGTWGVNPLSVMNITQQMPMEKKKDPVKKPVKKPASGIKKSK